MKNSQINKKTSKSKVKENLNLILLLFKLIFKLNNYRREKVILF